MEPKNARALNNLGVVLAALGRRDDAAQAYRDSIKADPRYSQSVGNLASMLEAEGKLTEALEELKRLLSIEPKNLDARLRLAGILRQLENYPESLQQYSAVLAEQPSMPEALKGMALAYAGTGQKAKALDCYKKLEALGGDDQEFRVDRALLLKDAGDTVRAQEEVTRYLADRPEDRRARIVLADIHAKQGHLRQAAQTLIEVLDANPQDTDASARLARLYRELGEPQKAIETMEGLINRLEQSTEPKDVEALSRAMEEYEKAIAEHEKDFREEREKAIRRLRELAVDSATPEKSKAADDVLIEDMEPLEEEAVPIINVGGLEPVFAVREEDEELKLEEVEEQVHGEEVAIEDERPPNLVNLLKDQELYAENPALEMFAPQPPLPSQAPRQPAAAAPPPQLPPPPAPATAPQQPMALSPQGESVLANSLRESVSAQSRVVEKLFDEMRDLSRKMDDRRAPSGPVPPIVVNMQSAQPARSPIVMDLPHSGPQPEGFPRYASDAEEQDEEQTFEPAEGPGEQPGEPEAQADREPEARPEEPEARPEEPEARPGHKPDSRHGRKPEAQPGEQASGEPPAKPRPSAAPPARPAGAKAADPDEVQIEEMPEDLGDMDEAADLEEIAVEPSPRGSPETGSLPGIGPVTDNEPEPEIAGGAEAPSNAAGPLPEGAARSSDEVRKELRDYLNGVRGRLDKGKGRGSPGDLLDYLGKLSDYLPDRERKKFRGSNERLAMESLKTRLAGGRGLRQKVAEHFRPAAAGPGARMTRSRVVDTFSYLRDLAAWLPDKTVAAAMRERIESIVARMGRLA